MFLSFLSDESFNTKGYKLPLKPITIVSVFNVFNASRRKSILQAIFKSPPWTFDSIKNSSALNSSVSTNKDIPQYQTF